jgi:glycerol-3-phosphate cytidylyltransferase-like family protein
MTLYERALSLLAYRQVSEVIMGVPRCISEAFIHHYGINLVARGQQSRFPSKGIDCFKVPKIMGIYHQIQSGSNVTTGQVKIYRQFTHIIKNVRKTMKNILLI